MKIYDNGIYRDMTAQETAEMQVDPIPYDQRVVNRIREKYSIDDELSLQRQRNEKPEEFAEYYAYCEKVKAEERGE